MGVEKHLPVESSPSATRLNKSHSVDIYRPPPLRRSQIESSMASTEATTFNKNVINGDLEQPISTQQKHNNSENSVNSNGTAMIINNEQQQRRRERRPDRAVYIPRARRSQTTPPSVVVVANHHNNDQQQQQQQQSEKQDVTTTTNNHQMIPNESVLIKPSCKSAAGGKSKDRKERKLPQQTNQNETIAIKSKGINSKSCDSSISMSNENANPIKECDKFENNSDLSSTTKSIESNQRLIENEFQNFNSTQNVDCVYEIQIDNMSVNSGDCNDISNGICPNVTQSPDLRIEDISHAVLNDSSRKCDIDEEELQRASKEINRSNRRIIKQTFSSDILEIPENILNSIHSSNLSKQTETKDENMLTPPPPPPLLPPPTSSTIVTISKLASNTTKQKTTTTDTTDEDDDDDDDWDSMFDESGECLDPKLIQELSASVGKVKIELPKMDYSSFLTKQSILNEEEFPHVLEVSNFPVEFKTQDLLMIFSQHKESGFDIKWVDDTHALAVFSSSRIAAEVLTMGHPFVVLKPLGDATVESRLKAKKCATSLQPYRPRPETCAALARRLVTGALGVRLKTAAAERENEKRVLREAKERKLLASKQRDDVWES